KISMRILWITPKWTLPVTDGARVATDSLLRNIVPTGALVDYWSLSNQDEKSDVLEMMSAWNVNEAKSDPRSLPSSSLQKKLYYLKKIITSPLTPLTFSSFSEERFLDVFSQKVSLTAYDFIVLDGLHL